MFQFSRGLPEWKSLGSYKTPAGLGFAVGGEVVGEAVGVGDEVEAGLPVVVPMGGLGEVAAVRASMRGAGSGKPCGWWSPPGLGNSTTLPPDFCQNATTFAALSS